MGKVSEYIYVYIPSVCMNGPVEYVCVIVFVCMFRLCWHVWKFLVCMRVYMFEYSKFVSVYARVHVRICVLIYQIHDQKLAHINHLMILQQILKYHNIVKKKTVNLFQVFNWYILKPKTLIK